MRSTYLVCYDIADAKRLRRVFQTCQDFGTHLQYSIFECDLALTERLTLETRLKEIIHHEYDQVLFVHLGPSEGRGDRVIHALGAPYVRLDAPCFVF